MNGGNINSFDLFLWIDVKYDNSIARILWAYNGLQSPKLRTIILIFCIRGKFHDESGFFCFWFNFNFHYPTLFKITS